MQSENKLCVVLLFGGMSSEHEVSRVSVGNFVNNIDRTKYEVLAVGITKEGRWLYTEATAAQMADGSWEELAGNMPCILSPDRADHGMVLFTPEGHVEKLQHTASASVSSRTAKRFITRPPLSAPSGRGGSYGSPLRWRSE